MIIKLELPKDPEELMKLKSSYQPSKEVMDRTVQVMADFTVGNDIMTSPYEEFNDRTVVQYQNHCQRAFNSYVPSGSDDPDEDWRANTVRPITRNKVISMAAHLTASTLFPKIFAQNKNDEEDKDAAQVMRDLMEWVADRSDYARKFLYSIIAMLVNPATIVHTEFRQVLRNIKAIQEDGTWKEEEIMDELLSGFQNNIVPVDELYISNAYEHDVQKQSCVIWRRVIDWSTAFNKHGDNENFEKFVKPGLQVVFNEDDQSFYEQYDEDITDNLVEEVIYYNRTQDLELTFVNGVLLDHVDQPMKRADKAYPFAKSGFELIDEGRFFYYRSLVDKLADDQNLADVMWNMILDGTFMQLMPPTAVFGEEDVDASVVVPGTVTTFKSDTKLESIAPQQNFSAAYGALDRIENNAAQSSQDPLQSGQGGGGLETAFEVARIEQNARTVLGLAGKMIGFFVRDWGELLVGNILQFLTVADVMEIASPSSTLKFRSFVLPEKDLNGKRVTRRIEFDEEAGVKDVLDESFELLDREENQGNIQIIKANPKLFRELKYLTRINPDFKTPESEQVKKAFNLEAYDRGIQNPLLNQEKVTREFFLSSYDQSRDDPDSFMAKQGSQRLAELADASPVGAVEAVTGGDNNLAEEVGSRVNANTVV